MKAATHPGRARRLPLLFVPLLLPSAIAAAALPVLVENPPARSALLLWRAALAFPVIVLPVLLALMRRQKFQSRAAAGLGAGWLDRLRLIWLPQLGPGIGASLLLAALFVLCDELIR